MNLQSVTPKFANYEKTAIPMPLLARNTEYLNKGVVKYLRKIDDQKFHHTWIIYE